MSLTLAPVARSDRDRLLDLWVESWSSTFPQLDFAARRPWFDARLDAFEAQGIQVLGSYAEDGLLQGFVTLDDKNGEIDQLCVALAAQGSGIAAALIEAAKSACPQGLCLTVNLDNQRALRFYEREGFSRGQESINPASGLRTITMHWRPILPP